MGRAARRNDAGEFKAHVKKGDQVLVLSGRSLGERGRVTSVDPQRERAVVEGVNLITKHQRPTAVPGSPAAARQQSGRIEKPSPIHLSNLMVVCPGCNTPTRVARQNRVGKHERTCKQCGAPLDRAA